MEKKSYNYIKQAYKLDPNNESVRKAKETFEKKFGQALVLAEQTKKDGTHLNIVQTGNLIYVGPQYYKEGQIPITPIEQKVFDEYNNLMKSLESHKSSEEEGRKLLNDKFWELTKKYNMTQENLTYLLLKMGCREVPPDTYKPPSEKQ